jgi:tetratricopeptide (TPR) repeat protein
MAQDTDFPEAIEALRKAILKDPAAPDAYEAMAVVLHRSDDVAGALEKRLQALSRFEEGSPRWSAMFAKCCKALMHGVRAADEMLPPWWNKAELCQMSSTALCSLLLDEVYSKEVRPEFVEEALYARAIVLAAPCWSCTRSEMVEAHYWLRMWVERSELRDRDSIGDHHRRNLQNLEQDILNSGGALTDEPAAESMIGRSVLMVGLRSRPALNGKMCAVSTWLGQQDRYVVELENGERVTMKRANLFDGVDAEQ